MNKPLRTIILIVLAIIIVGAGAYVLFTKTVLSPTVAIDEKPIEEGPVVQPGMKQYTNVQHGLRFSYPDGYVLTEKEVGNAERGHYMIMLVRAADAVPLVGGEGPTAITIDLYQNDTDRMSATDWITGTNFSNYKLGNGNLEMRKVGGIDAYTYTWSGLYEGRTTALAEGDQIVAISVTWLTPEDTIIGDYKKVLDSFTF